MQRVDTATAAAAPPTPDTPGTPGYFTKGDPAGPVPATVPGQDWFNNIQEEVVNLVQAGGIALDRASQTQARDAVKRLAGANVTTVAFADSPKTLTIADCGVILVDASAGAVSITLPAANALAAAPFTFVRVDTSTNAVTINRAGADTIFGLTAIQTGGQYSSVSLVADGVSKWFSRDMTSPAPAGYLAATTFYANDELMEEGSYIASNFITSGNWGAVGPTGAAGVTNPWTALDILIDRPVKFLELHMEAHVQRTTSGAGDCHGKVRKYGSTITPTPFHVSVRAEADGTNQHQSKGQNRVIVPVDAACRFSCYFQGSGSSNVLWLYLAGWWE